MKPLTVALLTAIVLSALTLTNITSFSNAQTGTQVNGIINQDTTWTKTNSPYSLTGPTSINKDVTLVIEAGVSVNLNNYYMQVNGTLVARGTSANKIYFDNGAIRFTSVGNSWSETTGSGCIIDNANLGITLVSARIPIKLNQNVITGPVSVSNSSIVTDNHIVGNLTAENYNTISNNKVSYGIIVKSNNVISNNDVAFNGIMTQNGCTISENIVGHKGASSIYSIRDGISTGDGCTIYGNTVEGEIYCGYSSSVVDSNSIHGSVITGSSTVNGTLVTNNNIKGVVVADGLSTVSNNIITADSGLINIYLSGLTLNQDLIDSVTRPAVTIKGGSPSILNNHITGGGILHFYDFKGRTRDFVFDAFIIESGSPTISNNFINGSETGIRATINGDSSLFFNNTVLNSGGIIIKSIGSVWAVKNVSPFMSIATSAGNFSISDNIITQKGISLSGNGILERNYVHDSATGIHIASGFPIVRNNTISNNEVGIEIHSPSQSILIYGNNVESNDVSIRLGQGSTNNLNATDNWWGTTDAQKINQSIYDFKSDFNLGTVNFVPFLTEPNQQATPNSDALMPTPIPLATPILTPMPAQSASPGQLQTPAYSPVASINDQPNTQSAIQTGNYELIVALGAVIVALVITVAGLAIKNKKLASGNKQLTNPS